MSGFGTSVHMKTCGHSSCNTIIGGTSDFCDKHRKQTSTKTEEPMALVPMSPASTPDEDAPEVKPVHHINRRKGHEKIILDLLKRKIIRKGMLQAEAPTEDKDQTDQDNNAAKT